MKNLGSKRHLVATAFAALTLMGAGTMAAHAELPAVQRQGNVEFVTGGIGQSESDSMKAAEKNYPLSLVFAKRMQGENAYASDVPVTIKDSKGTTVLKTTTTGPFLLVKLPAGQYKISATNDGKEQTHDASVQGPGSARIVFEWR
jgi:hypothetical protein